MAAAATSTSALAAIRIFVDGTTTVQQTQSFLQAYNVEEVCDSLWFLDEELAFQASSSATPASSPANTKRDKLCELIQALATNHHDLLCTTLSMETLERSRLVSEADKTKIVLRRVNTNQKYRQSKFNLVRESSEGFSKLICELLCPQCSSNNVLAFMGEFQLDPNRVLDLCVDLLPENFDAVLSVINDLFPSVQSDNKLIDLLNFKLSRTAAVAASTSKLCDSIALLIIANILSTQQMISLLQRRDLVDSVFASLLGARKPAWNPYAMECLKFIPPSTMFSSNKAVDAFQTMLFVEISALYETYYSPAIKSPLTTPRELNFNLSTLEDFANKVIPLLLVVGPNAVSNSKLLTRLVRLFGKCLQENSTAPAGLWAVCGQVLLPALSLLPTSNPQVSRELWNELVEKLGVEQRYALYHAWNVSLRAQAKHASLVKTRKDCQSSLKRFCLDANKNVFPTMQLSKAANNNPLVSFDCILVGIRQQVDVQIIDAIVSAFKFTTPMSLDALCFLLCRELSLAGSSEVNAMSNARLVGKLFAQEHKVDYSALMQTLLANYTLNQNLVGSLTCLEEMIQVSSGLHIVNEYDETMLRSAAGGKLLRFLSRLSQDDKLKLAEHPNTTQKQQQERLDHLVHWLGQQCMHGKLLRALATCRERPNIEFVLYDTCTSSLIQLADVLLSQNVDLSALRTETCFSKELLAHIFRNTKGETAATDLFWAVSLSDLLHPKSEYQYEMDKLSQVKRPQPATLALVQTLKQENDAIEKRCAAFTTLLAAHAELPLRVATMEFMVHDLIPRMLFSQEDALTCALFLQRIVGGRERDILAILFSRDFLAVFFSCTDRELQCLSIFLAESLAWSRKTLKLEEEEDVLKSYNRAVADVVLDAMRCMGEDGLISRAFQLVMYLMNRDSGSLFPSHLEVAEYMVKTLDDDILLTATFIERNNLLLQKLRRKIAAESPPPPTSAPATVEEKPVVTAPTPPANPPPVVKPITTTTPAPPAAAEVAAPTAMAVKPSEAPVAPSNNTNNVDKDQAPAKKESPAASEQQQQPRNTSNKRGRGNQEASSRSKRNDAPTVATAAPADVVPPISSSRQGGNRRDEEDSRAARGGGADKPIPRLQPRGERQPAYEDVAPSRGGGRGDDAYSSRSSHRDRNGATAAEERGRNDDRQRYRNDDQPQIRSIQQKDRNEDSRRDETSSSRRNEDSRREEMLSSRRNEDFRRDETSSSRRNNSNNNSEVSRRDAPSRRADNDEQPRGQQRKRSRKNSVPRQQGGSTRVAFPAPPPPPMPPPPPNAPPPPPSSSAIPHHHHQSRNRSPHRQSKRYRDDDHDTHKRNRRG